MSSVSNSSTSSTIDTVLSIQPAAKSSLDVEKMRIVSDLKLLEEKFKLKIVKKLGSGGFSRVYLATQGNNQFAIKIIYINPELPDEKKSKILDWSKNEKIICTNLKNKNCIRCHNYTNLEYSNAIFLELASQGDLSSLVKNFYSKNLFEINLNCYSADWINFMSESFVRFYFDQVINGLSYLREMNLIHRDLKLENLLINSKSEVKISDFALANSVPLKGDYNISLAGTPAYMAPEVINSDIDSVDSQQAFKIDYYSLGVILYKMLYGEYFVQYKSKEKIKTEKIKDQYEILKGNYQERRKVSEDAIDLLRRLLDYFLLDRADLEEIKGHKWIKSNIDKIDNIKEKYGNVTNKMNLELQKLDDNKNTNIDSKKESKIAIISKEENQNKVYNFKIETTSSTCATSILKKKYAKSKIKCFSPK
jgi:serine/threonine protein kinase